MSDYMAESGRTLHFEFRYCSEIKTGTISPIYKKETGKKFFHVRWWTKEKETSSESVWADFEADFDPNSEIVTWIPFTSGISDDEIACAQTAMVERLRDAGCGYIK